ncbi:MobC family replication-relaxation protein [Pseudobacteriovorax antillogorgiicola]|uniref:Replication-relaxation n=1 Tax=Pseudobacteriovorax antillogorgiicola TaxID=1513793 RepID=A0A1Y6B6S6_9BACT|nr:MobC family replication-relaxation protein [Pseudobacteriovorax antillogorgiicola]TCS58753.1 hypothetical protein EDD56_102267 [Pseudobacteriovorax antillogorgiicola]SME95128.1 hypothetical protein SAMN06296036_102176 [Pseudobacteriovorax antillogorgiicola]
MSNLLSGRKGSQRAREKQQQILSFLLSERWTHPDILAYHLGLKSKYSVVKTLCQLKQMGAVKEVKIDIPYGGSIDIWGITNHGIGISRSEFQENVRALEPSKLSLVSMFHHLDLQKARVLLTKHQKCDWVRISDMPTKSKKQPDAIMVTEGGQRIAIEMERTLKSRKRYSEILVSHLIARKQGLWDEILYIAPDQNLAHRLKRYFLNIGSATHQGRRFQVTADHLSYFGFTDLASLEQDEHELQGWTKHS